MRPVLLISPPYRLIKGRLKSSIPPLGLAYLAAYLEERRIPVQIIDAALEGFDNGVFSEPGYMRYGLGPDDLARRIRNIDPWLVGVTCNFSPQAQLALEVCRIAKGVNPEIITVLGGHHPSLMPDVCLEDEVVDHVVIGEGEETFTDLISCIRDGGQREDVAEIAFRHNGNIHFGPKRNFIKDLDTIPFPARHLLPMEKYFAINLPQGSTGAKHQRHAAIYTSRGCPWSCIFCATTRFWGNRYRARSALNVVAEIQHLIETYGVREIHISDDNFTVNKQRVIEICQEIIRRGLDIKWCCPQGVAISTLDREMLEIMRASGCYELTIAIESGNEHVLNNIIGKPFKLKKVKEIVKIMKDLGILIDSFFVVGSPGETMEQIKQTFEFADSLHLDRASFFIATPLPGTRLMQICEGNNYLEKDFDISSIDYSRGYITTEDFNAKQLTRFVKRKTLLFSLKLLERNPQEFFDRYVRYLLRDPLHFLRYLKFLLTT